MSLIRMPSTTCLRHRLPFLQFRFNLARRRARTIHVMAKAKAMISPTMSPVMARGLRAKLMHFEISVARSK
jgi:hypothetical protein